MKPALVRLWQGYRADSGEESDLQISAYTSQPVKNL
jgi:hypothetical protein